jgi:hypothetical protein
VTRSPWQRRFEFALCVVGVVAAAGIGVAVVAVLWAGWAS